MVWDHKRTLHSGWECGRVGEDVTVALVGKIRNLLTKKSGG